MWGVRSPAVSAIAEAKRDRSEATGIDAQWVLLQLTKVYRRCVQEVRPALHPKTRRQLKSDAGELPFDPGLAEPHFEAREFWQALRDPNTGRNFRYPGGFAVVDGQRLKIPRPPPLPGEHEAEIFE